MPLHVVHKRLYRTLRTTCCQMFFSFRLDSGFSKKSTAPSSMPRKTSVLLLVPDIRTSGNPLTVFKNMLQSGAPRLIVCACRQQDQLTLVLGVLQLPGPARVQRPACTRAIYLNKHQLHPNAGARSNLSCGISTAVARRDCKRHEVSVEPLNWIRCTVNSGDLRPRRSNLPADNADTESVRSRYEGIAASKAAPMMTSRCTERGGAKFLFKRA